MIKPTDRIINTHEPSINFKKISIEDQHISVKPRGLWYAIGNAWVEWMKREHFRTEQLYNYKIELNFSKIILLDTKEKVESFSQKYGKDMRSVKLKDNMKNFFTLIDWHEVCKIYSGIECNPYFMGNIRSILWYNCFDIPSGCIWEEDAVKRIIKIEND